MPDYSTTLYDTAVFGNSANVDHTLFQEAQGASATATKSKTNSRGAGQLPQNEEFEVRSIHASYDGNAALADEENWLKDSYLEFRLSDETIFECPLRWVASRNAFGGHYSQGTAADESMIGLIGEGYMLDIPIVIRGGTGFRVTVHQGTALSAASQNVKVVLKGTLTRP